VTLSEALDAAATAFVQIEVHGDQLDSLTPEERRDAHDKAVRLSDRLMSLMAELVSGMAADGADLVDDRGVPRDYSLGVPKTS